MEQSLIIRELRRRLGVSQERFAESIGMKRANFGHVETGKNSLTIGKLDEIARIYRINIPIFFEMLKAPEEMLDPLLSQLLKENDKESIKDDLINIPVTEIEVAAGHGATNKNFIEYEEYIHIPKSMLPSGDGDRFCITVTGESMSQTLQEGDKLIVRRLRRSDWDKIEDNEIYAVMNRNGESYVKRIRNRLQSDGFITLLSDNPARKYKPFNIQEEDLHHIWAIDLYILNSAPNCSEQTITEREIGILQDEIADLKKRMDDLKNRQL